MAVVSKRGSRLSDAATFARDERLADLRRGRNDAKKAPAALRPQFVQLGPDHVEGARARVEAVEAIDPARFRHRRIPGEQLASLQRRQRKHRKRRLSSLLAAGIGWVVAQWIMQAPPPDGRKAATSAASAPGDR